MANVIPTKGNLMAVKRSLALAHLGYELMDRKRNILIREMMMLIDRAAEIQGKIDVTFKEAYAALQSAHITLGISSELAQNISVDVSLSLRFRSVMGVAIPILHDSDEKHDLEYGVLFSNSILDEATDKFVKVKRFTRELAEMETSIYRLAYAIKKTQKRANALQNIIIPNFSNNVKFITDALEEKEREEFVRLKVIKARV